MMTIDQMREAASGAIFSDCGKYRFVLWRGWRFHLPYVMFICLNPSTANAHKNDATMTRVIELSKFWGFGGVYMLNLFPFMATKPEDLFASPLDRIKENDMYLMEYAGKSNMIVFAWGSFPVMGRDRDMIKRFPDAKALIMNDDGTPRHPLYVPKNTMYIPYQSTL